MLKLNKILVPTDFSDAARTSYAFAVELTRKYGGTIDLLHVIPMFRYLNESISRLGLPINLDKDIYPHLITESEERLKDEFLANIPEPQRGNAIVQVDMKASDAIIFLAAKKNVDLIVMGATGVRGRDILWGSTTEKVVRNSTVPVLAVPEVAMPKDIHRILVPSDYSELSFNSIRGAVSMADSLNAEITVLHVLELHGSLAENEPRPAGSDEMEVIRGKIIARLDNWMLKHPEFKLSLKSDNGNLAIISTRGGNPKSVQLSVVVTKAVSAHAEIIEYADEHADMVVLTTHGRSGLSHMFLGSTTEKVVQATNKPVLTWRPS
jgi:nucleotide-binding universal stress UspA family protein